MFSRWEEWSTFILHKRELSMTMELIRQQREVRRYPCTYQTENTHLMSPTCLPLPKSKAIYCNCKVIFLLSYLHFMLHYAMGLGISQKSRWVEEQTTLGKITGENCIFQTTFLKRRERGKWGIFLQCNLKYFLITNINYKCLF